MKFNTGDLIGDNEGNYGVITATSDNQYKVEFSGEFGFEIDRLKGEDLMLWINKLGYKHFDMISTASLRRLA